MLQSKAINARPSYLRRVASFGYLPSPTGIGHGHSRKQADKDEAVEKMEQAAIVGARQIGRQSRRGGVIRT